MALPPERISIKRRRQDEPVDTLVLESGSARNKKRRFTDFYFQRLRHDKIPATISGLPARDSASAATPTSTSHHQYQNLGIPTVKTSAPGDEIKDFARYRATQKANVANSDGAVPKSVASQESRLLSSDRAASARRFHLTHDLSVTPGSKSVGGIQRSKVGLRPPLATFIEHYNIKKTHTKSIYVRPPVDSIVELKENVAANDAAALKTDSIGKRSHVSTFLKSTAPVTRRGISIRDDPNTWDHDSDQLANELAALAFSIDPADAMEPPQVLPVVDQANTTIIIADPPAEKPTSMDLDEDFIFETYIRVKHDPRSEYLHSRHESNIGVLVIDDENEDLWERYIHSDDDDDEWDEEDEDSNAEDNPRNEYPDDEVSTDDEFDRNVYRHRRNGSDKEEYDAEQDEW